MVYLHASSHLFHKCCTINLKESSFLNLPFRAQHDIRPHSKKILDLGLFKIKCVHIKSKKLARIERYHIKRNCTDLFCCVTFGIVVNSLTCLSVYEGFSGGKLLMKYIFFNNPLQ